MKQQASGFRPRDETARRRPGWAAILGFILAIVGLALLVMVLLAVVFGSSWLPVYGAAGEPPPTLISRLAPALAPAPLRGAVVLPTPLPDEFFSAAAGAPESGFGPVALLPQSPAGNGQSAGQAPTGSIARLEIPAIGVNAPIQSVGLIELEENGQRYLQWRVPNAYAVGWHTDSAPPGSPGNTVLNGHNNVYGSVFRDLSELQLGDEMTVYDDGQTYRYQVAHRELVEEKDQPLEVRLNNARWMFPTADERLTLISCWPNIGITHRVIVVATAVGGE